MAKYYPKAGYKGAVLIGAVQIAGSATWGYGGSERTMLPTDEFGDEIVSHIPGQITGGVVTVTGSYLMSQDAGQQLLKTRFDSGDQITDLKLFFSETDDIYLTPDNSTSPPSYATVINYDAVDHDKSGIGTFTCTFQISGKMLPTYS